MKAFHTHLGAFGFVQRETSGTVGVLIVQPKGRKLVTLKVTFDLRVSEQPVEVAL